MKYCKYCKIDHPKTSDFWVFYPNGWIKQCKTKKKDTDRNYYETNRDKCNKKNKKYTLLNKEKIVAYRKKYYHDNKEELIGKINKWKSDNKDKFRRSVKANKKKRWANDVQYRLKENTRHRIWIALRGTSRSKHNSKLDHLGCTILELKRHLESKFQEGMNWDNYGLHGWHVDHIKPLSRFDLSNDDELTEACCYTNLQPLWAIDNLKKSNKFAE